MVSSKIYYLYLHTVIQSGNSLKYSQSVDLCNFKQYIFNLK